MKIKSSLLMLVMTSVMSFNLQATQLTAQEIVKRSDEAMRGESGYSELTMNIIRPEWKRSMSMKSWSKGLDLSMVLVTKPAKDKGSASLKRYNEMWSWVPSIEKVIKIAPSMLGQSWMGSDFTNDDLINQSSIVVDYEHQIVGEEMIDGAQTWIIDAYAKPEAPVVWTKVRMWISKEHLLQRKVEFYDEFEDLVNTMQTYEVKEMGGRMIATRMEMIPADEPGYKTEMITHAAQFDFEISDGFFSQNQMKALRN